MREAFPPPSYSVHPKSGGEPPHHPATIRFESETNIANWNETEKLVGAPTTRIRYSYADVVRNSANTQNTTINYNDANRQTNTVNDVINNMLRLEKLIENNSVRINTLTPLLERLLSQNVQNG